MRPVGHDDVIAAARVLVRVAPRRRRWVLHRMICEARRAQLRLQAGSASPYLGDGSLMSAALSRHPGPELRLDHRDYCACLAFAYRVFARQAEGDYPRAQLTQSRAVGSASRRACAMSSPQS